MAELSGTRYEDAVPRRTLSDLDERLRRSQRLMANTLLLCDTPGQCAAAAADLQTGPLAGNYVALDAAGLKPRELYSSVHNLLASHYGWPELGPVSASEDKLAETFASLDAIRRASSHLGAEPGPKAGPDADRPVVLIWNIDTEVAHTFAIWRDELWGISVPWVVVAPWADKNRYLLTYSDSFFFDGGLYYLT